MPDFTGSDADADAVVEGGSWSRGFGSSRGTETASFDGTGIGMIGRLCAGDAGTASGRFWCARWARRATYFWAKALA